MPNRRPANPAVAVISRFWSAHPRPSIATGCGGHNYSNLCPIGHRFEQLHVKSNVSEPAASGSFSLRISAAGDGRPPGAHDQAVPQDVPTPVESDFPMQDFLDQELRFRWNKSLGIVSLDGVEHLGWRAYL